MSKTKVDQNHFIKRISPDRPAEKCKKPSVC